jgi:hypothetical protein
MDINNFFLGNLADGLTEVMNGIMDFLMISIEAIYKLGERVALGSELSAINIGTIGIETVSTVLLCVMVAMQAFTTYITETDGDPDMDPTQLLLKFSMGLAIMWAVFPIFSISLDWGEKIASLLMGAAEISIKSDMDATYTILARVGNPAVSVILCFVFLLAVIFFCFKAALRGAELVLFRIVWSVFCCDFISPSREKWNSFAFAFAVTTFSYGIQMLLFKAGMLFLVNTRGGQEAPRFFMGMAFIYMACKAPQWITKFIYNSGVGQVATGIGRTALLIGMRI